MPADATFRRLHDVIQTVTNFRDSHLYQFDLREQENLIITDDEEAYQEHKYFQNNKDKILKNLKDISPKYRDFEQARIDFMSTPVRKPQSIKIDTFLEKHGELQYRYDFGDDWRFFITLEDIVDDYYFGYPTLLDGAGTAPPEDVGGLAGFYQFWEIYEDEEHPEHEGMRKWAEEMIFHPYDPERINDILKHVRYKKTEWDKINHQNYEVIEDKYRK